MIEAPIGVRLVRGRTRCFPYITDLQTFYAVTSAALEKKLGYETNEHAHMILACRAADADVGLPLAGYLDAALSGKAPDEIVVRIDSKLPEPEGVNASGMDSISTHIVAAIFALFVETGLEWLRHHHKKQVQDWPPVCNFCRVVRNAIVHGGSINLDSPTAAGASWRGLHYDYRSKGRKILNTGDLSIGDLVILMLEMEAELNDLGAPFDLS